MLIGDQLAHAYFGGVSKLHSIRPIDAMLSGYYGLEFQDLRLLVRWEGAMKPRKFLRDEAGAVTVDMVAIMGAVVTLGVAVVANMSGGLRNISGDISNSLGGMSSQVATTGTDWFNDINSLQSGGSATSNGSGAASATGSGQGDGTAGTSGQTGSGTDQTATGTDSTAGWDSTATDAQSAADGTSGETSGSISFAHDLMGGDEGINKKSG